MPILCDCDVIIVNYNAGHFLADSVESALNEGARRVIVVDNHSGDDSLYYLQTCLSDERICVIRNSQNRGFAAACNQGARIADAETLLFLNPDCILSPGALNRLYAVLKSHPEIGMVGGLLCNLDGSEQPGGRRVFPTPRRAFIRAFGLYRFSKWFPSLCTDFLLHQTPLPKEPVAVESISGACMLVKRVAIDAVGLWDEGYFLHCEDMDWCMRFHLKGWQVIFVPDAQVTHAWRVCSKSRPFFVEWHKHCGMLRFYRKFFKTQYSGILWSFVFIGVWLRFSLVSAYHAAQLVRYRLGARRV